MGTIAAELGVHRDSVALAVEPERFTNVVFVRRSRCSIRTRTSSALRSVSTLAPAIAYSPETRRAPEATPWGVRPENCVQKSRRPSGPILRANPGQPFGQNLRDFRSHFLR
jgi:hypothetical protein